MQLRATRFSSLLSATVAISLFASRRSIMGFIASPADTAPDTAARSAPIGTSPKYSGSSFACVKTPRSPSAQSRQDPAAPPHGESLHPQISPRPRPRSSRSWGPPSPGPQTPPARSSPRWWGMPARTHLPGRISPAAPPAQRICGTPRGPPPPPSPPPPPPPPPLPPPPRKNRGGGGEGGGGGVLGGGGGGRGGGGATW